MLALTGVFGRLDSKVIPPNLIALSLTSCAATFAGVASCPTLAGLAQAIIDFPPSFVNLCLICTTRYPRPILAVVLSDFLEKPEGAKRIACPVRRETT